MKKALSLALALALALCSVVALSEGAPVEEEEGVFEITLTGNPTTGYEWTYVAGEEGIVTIEEEYLTSADVDALAGVEGESELLCGEGGFYIFTVRGVKPGNVLLAFEYAQSWDEESTVAGLMYELTVNEDLSVVCTATSLGIL